MARTAAMVAVALSLMGLPASAAGATSLVSLDLHMSPSRYHVGQPVVFYGSVTRVSGTPTNVRITLELPSSLMSGECQPACIDGSGIQWLFATVTGRTTFTFSTSATGLGEFARLYLAGGSAGCASGCPAGIDLQAARASMHTSLSYEAGAPVVSGSTIHVRAVTTANATGVEGMLVVDLPDGVGTPVNITGGASYYGDPSFRVEGLVLLTPSSGYEFDLPITAPNGTSLAISGWFSPSYDCCLEPTTMIVKVGPDGVAPTVTAPRASLVTGSRATGAPVRLSWSGADKGSGVQRYALWQQVDGGAWSVVSRALTAPSTVRSLASGHRYRFRVRAVDHAGNVGTWAYGSTFTLTGFQESSRAIAYAGSWSSLASSGYWGGHAKAGSPGGSATFTTTARSVSWVSDRSPSRGYAAVYVNGTRVATVDLWAPETQTRRVVWSATWSTATTRVITVKALTSYGPPRSIVDGFLAIR